MKWYKIFNKVSLILHVLGSAAGYFLIEAMSRHSFESMGLHEGKSACVRL